MEESWWIDGVDDSWVDNFYKQKALLAKIGKPAFTEFNREGGFMEYIGKLVRKEYGISSKDN